MTRRAVLALALAACVGFIAYQTLAAGGTWACGGPALSMPKRIARTDLVANVVGYMPLGVLGVMAFAPRRSVAGWLLPAGLTIVLGSALSVGLELVQACQSARVSSLLDVLANSAGTTFGAVVGVVLRSFAPASASVSPIRWRERRLRLVTAMVPVLWLLSQTLPWVFTVDLGGMRSNLSFLRRWQADLAPEIWPLLRHTAAWLAIGCACRLVAGTPWRAIVGLTGTVVVIVGAQVLSDTRRPLSFNELAGIVLAVVTLAPAMAWRGRSTRGGPWAVGLAVCAAGGILAYELEPGSRTTMQAFRWLPQVGLSRPIDVLDFALLFGWLGVAVTAAAHWRDAETCGKARVTWPLAAVLFTAGLEVAQLWVPGRGPDLSPPLLTAMATLAVTAILRDDRAA